nr:oxysterol-binding protein like c23h4.01c [Quercus suber]
MLTQHSIFIGFASADSRTRSGRISCVTSSGISRSPPCARLRDDDEVRGDNVNVTSDRNRSLFHCLASYGHSKKPEWQASSRSSCIARYTTGKLSNYVVRWIQVPEHQSISWSVQPTKRSINFGIFRHPGSKNGLTPNLPTSQETEEPPPTPGIDGLPAGKRGRQGSVGRNEASTAVEKLQSIGLKCVAWYGKCEADKVSVGLFDVVEGEGGMYGLVFDNTFSKQTSKNVNFVLITHPTNAPPKSGHHLRYAQAFGTETSRRASNQSHSPKSAPGNGSNESLPHVGSLHKPILEDPRPVSKGGVESKGVEGSSFYTGVLHKKRRKKGQGYAKRFFSLDFTSSTLSYYQNRHSSALRGAVPLSLAAVGANEKTREFSIDSGAEVWHLKAANRKDYEGWLDALERAASSAHAIVESAPVMPGAPRNHPPNPVEEREWHRVEQLVGKVSGTRDAIRALAKDTDPKYGFSSHGLGLVKSDSAGSSSAPSPALIETTNPFFPDLAEDRAQDNKRPFWKRKASAERSPAALMRRSVSAQLAVPSPSAVATSPGLGSFSIPKSHNLQQMQTHDDVHERCMALLRDLNSVVSDFATLLAESKARRIPHVPASSSRLSLDSIDDQEFFDANDGAWSQVLNIRRSSGEHEEQISETASATDTDADSDIDGIAGAVSALSNTPKATQGALFAAKPQTLSPLPLSPVNRRGTIPAPKQAPPSIIGFLRKNAGKDLSTVSMPVTANEPTSLLQRLAESMEYAKLLDSAASSSITPAERLMYVTAFAISYFANSRVKERAVRKPFNPMLGETFELVREDLSFRFVAEKVSHHPVRMACQADSLTNGGWCFTQSPQPVQKFWGRSVELNTEGRARVILHGPGEYYSWSQATCVLRNVIAGEKYVEPVQSMTVLCETNGLHAVATFKEGGMFSGRSEEVTVTLHDGETQLPLGLAGKWTDSLKRTDTHATVWQTGALVPDAAKVYGFTTFAAALNQITEVEDGHLPPTDSRLRPDQQALEKGDVDQAEALKARLEERQRARRKVLEGHGRQWKPQFFDKVEGGAGGEEVWMLKGEGGYWEKRTKGDWSGVDAVFEV